MSNSGHHDCSRKAVFPCTAVKLQSCHMLAHSTQHTGSSPPFNQHSFSFSCSMKFFLRLALGKSCAACLTTEKHWCPVSTFSYFHGKAFLGKPATITFGENKDVNSWIKFRLLYDKSFAPALGGACAMGTNTMALIQMCQIQAIMTVPERLSLSAQLSNCNLATCWHIELIILGLLIQYSFEHRLQLFYQVFSIENNPWAGLGQILAVACANTEKHWCPQRPASCGKAFLRKPATITFGENKDVNSSIKFRL